MSVISGRCAPCCSKLPIGRTAMCEPRALSSADGAGPGPVTRGPVRGSRAASEPPLLVAACPNEGSGSDRPLRALAGDVVQAGAVGAGTGADQLGLPTRQPCPPPSPRWDGGGHGWSSAGRTVGPGGRTRPQSPVRPPGSCWARNGARGPRPRRTADPTPAVQGRHRGSVQWSATRSVRSRPPRRSDEGPTGAAGFSSRRRPSWRCCTSRCPAWLRTPA